MSDLLSFFVNGEMAETYVKKIYKLMSIVIIFTLIWAAIDLLEWYKFIENSPVVSRLSHPFYRYKMWPIIWIMELAMDITVNVLFYQAWGNLKSFIETSDDNLMHKGLQTFYNATILTIIWFIISIINTFYRTFIL